MQLRESISAVIYSPCGVQSMYSEHRSFTPLWWWWALAYFTVLMWQIRLSVWCGRDGWCFHGSAEASFYNIAFNVCRCRKCTSVLGMPESRILSSYWRYRDNEFTVPTNDALWNTWPGRQTSLLFTSSVPLFSFKPELSIQIWIVSIWNITHPTVNTKRIYNVRGTVALTDMCV